VPLPYWPHYLDHEGWKALDIDGVGGEQRPQA
jgi:hypothetical protein